MCAKKASSTAQANYSAATPTAAAAANASSTAQANRMARYRAEGFQIEGDTKLGGSSQAAPSSAGTSTVLGG